MKEETRSRSSGLVRPHHDPSTGRTLTRARPAAIDFCTISGRMNSTFVDSPELSTTVDPYGNCDFWDTVGYDLNPAVEAVNAVLRAALEDESGR